LALTGVVSALMIMLNGICVSDAQTGHYAMNLPVPLSAIERIEVLEGVAASLAGGNAFCGAINIMQEPACSTATGEYFNPAPGPNYPYVIIGDFFKFTKNFALNTCTYAFFFVPLRRKRRKHKKL